VNQDDQQIRVPKSSEIIAGILRRQIIKGDLALGDNLPPEPDLIARFHVSRPTVREAMRMLEAEGLIRVGRGIRNGARVEKPDALVAARYAGHFLQYEQTTIADVYSALAGLEAHALWLIATARDPETIAELRRTVEEGEHPPPSSPHAERSHEALHQRICELPGNQTIMFVSRMLRDIITIAVDDAYRRLGPAPPQVQKQAEIDHRRALDLVEAGNAMGALVFWHQHVERMTEYVESVTVPTVLDLLQ
jgi:GntR family transcriptional repressor for pyruvate dehydrogenase complex